MTAAELGKLDADQLRHFAEEHGIFLSYNSPKEAILGRLCRFCTS